MVLKKFFFTSGLLLLGIGTGYCQEATGGTPFQAALPNRAIHFNFGIFYTPVAGVQAAGIFSDLGYQVSPRFVSGIGFMGVYKRTDNSFTYAVAEPVLGLLDLGWKNQYYLIASEKIRLGVDFTTGITIARLSDNTETSVIYNGNSTIQAPKTKVKSVLFHLRPGVEVAIRLPDIKGTSNWYLTGCANYRLVAGSPAFGSAEDFSSYTVGVGVKFIAGFGR